MISIKNYKNIKSVNSDFVNISKYFEKKINKYWWFMNFSRLDLAPMGLPKNEKILEKIKNFINSLLMLLKFFFVSFFLYKKKKFNGKVKIFVFEEIKLNFRVKDKEEYYFKNISRETNIDFKNLIIGLKIYNDSKNFSIFEFFGRIEIIRLFYKSLLIYIKYLISKNKIINNSVNKKFWKIYQNKNSFINFFLTILVNNFFTKFDYQKNTIIFPYEEKPFERAININIKKKDKKFANIFAYLINPRDELALYFNKYKEINIPRCNKYLFPGKVSEKRFNKTFRENLLKNKKPVIGTPKGNIKKLNYKKPKNFLILIGHPLEFKIIFNWLKQKYLNTNVKFIFRFPPGISIKQFKNILSKYKNFLISENSTLIKDCELAKYSIFSNTSAGIESVNLGLVSIWVKTYNLKISPLEKKNYKIFFSSSGSKDLFRYVNRLLNINNKTFKKYHMEQFKITSNMYSRFNRKNFIKFINAKRVY